MKSGLKREKTHNKKDQKQHLCGKLKYGNVALKTQKARRTSKENKQREQAKRASKKNKQKEQAKRRGKKNKQ